MKFIPLLCFYLINSGTVVSQPALNDVQDDITVYIFLREDCIISEHYTLLLKELHTEFASEQLVFKGIFPNASSDDMDVLIFRGQYEMPFAMLQDEGQLLTRKFGATITPEVVVYNESQESILYKGRIDDTYFRVGKKRRVTTTSELKDVLEAIVKREEVITPFTDAVGCFIQLE